MLALLLSRGIGPSHQLFEGLQLSLGLELRAQFQMRKWGLNRRRDPNRSDGPDTATKEDDGMNEAAKAQAPPFG